MAKKAVHKKIEEVSFEVDREAFAGPFTCHGKGAKKARKRLSREGISLDYDVWRCGKCGKEYIDGNNARKLETALILDKMLNDSLVMRRSVNFDGKMFFIRFPLEITKKWPKGSHADIIPIDGKRFVVEIN